MFTVRAHDANLTHDTDLFDRMDPYLVLYYGGDRKQSTVREEGGRNPRWGDTFNFNRTGDTVLRVQVWDKDTISADDLIGEGQANIGQILNGPPGTSISIPVELYYKGKRAGRLNLSVSNGMGMGMGGMGMGGMGMGMNMYPQQGGMYPQGGMGMGMNMYPQQGGMYPQGGMGMNMYPQQGGMYPQQGGYPQGGMYPGGNFNSGW